MDQPTDDQVREALAACPLFVGVAPDEVAQLVARTRHTVRSFERGETMIHAGDVTDSLAIIVSGCVEIQKYLATGNVVTVFHRQRGEMVGGYALFSEQAEAPYVVTAVEPSQLLFVAKVSVTDVLFGDRRVATNMMRLYAGRVRQLEGRLELFAYSSIQQKIAFCLLNDFQADQGSTVILPFTRTAWAEYLNVSRPSLSRELMALRDRGVLRVDGRRVTVLDKQGLEDILYHAYRR